MPIFNPNIRYLSESAKDILSQTYDKIELVTVLDRCNTDVDDPAFTVLEQFHDEPQIAVSSEQ